MAKVMSLFLCGLAALSVAQRPAGDYRDEVQKFRTDSQLELTGENGWLSVVGLFWLPPSSTVGFSIDSKGHPQLPCPSAMVPTGSFTRSGDEVKLYVGLKSGVLVNGKAAQSGPVLADADRVSLGAVTMTVIRRGARVGIRVYDSNSDARKDFKGQKWFPVDPKLRIQAKYVAYDTPKSMPITNVLGDTQPVPNPGYVEFSYRGKLCRLEAQDAGSGFFFNFTDLTTGKSTYPAGRFLDAPKPVDGFVTLDFNKATNPPCAFTAFATCPLPPSANALKVEIKAGEKTHHPKE